MLEVLRGCRDHQDGCGKTLPLIADGNLPAELKTRGWNTVAGSDPEPRRAFWPRKTGTNRGRSRPQNVCSRGRIVGGVHGLVPELSRACLVLEVDPRAEPWVE